MSRSNQAIGKDKGQFFVAASAIMEPVVSSTLGCCFLLNEERDQREESRGAGVDAYETRLSMPHVCVGMKIQAWLGEGRSDPLASDFSLSSSP